MNFFDGMIRMVRHVVPLTTNQIAVLLLLNRRVHTVAELATELRLASQHVTMVLNSLETMTDPMIVRYVTPGDRRRRSCALTPFGRTIIEVFDPDPPAA